MGFVTHNWNLKIINEGTLKFSKHEKKYFTVFDGITASLNASPRVYSQFVCC